VEIRNYQRGDEEAQAAIYNQAAAGLPRFKPATVIEVRRRCQARDFDPGSRFYALEGPEVASYVTIQANGRVSYPWCRPGHGHLAEPLFERALEALRQRGQHTAFAAYRGDWEPVRTFFEGHGFHLAREMVNFILELVDMPTPPARPSSTITPLQRQDVPAILGLAPNLFRVHTAAELERHLFDNPYFGPDAVCVLRGRSGGEPLAAGLFIEEPTYADPRLLDANMPCFRLGAFGTEGMTTKRINGLFSFVTAPAQSVAALGLDLVGHAAFQMQKSDLGTFAAQVPSDVPHLLGFYQRHFTRQGSFPIYVRELGQS
jgi:hypothetical protein